MIRIAQFSGPEAGGIYGKPGDQKQLQEWNPNPTTPGEETNVIEDSGDWEWIYRPKRLEVANRAAQIMEDAARNKHIGYSQGADQRYTFLDELKSTGGDAKKIKRDCNSDCSAGTTAALIVAGVNMTKEVVTWTVDRVYMATGEFYKIPYKGSVRKRGDVVWRTGHMAMIIDTEGSLEAVAIGEATATTNIRTEPSIRGSVCGILKPGQTADITGEPFDDERGVKWYPVRFAEKYTYGFISEKYFNKK